MKITVEQLVAAGVNPTQAKVFVDPLSAACALFDIGTPLRVAAFVAQCVHESAGFARLEENLFYSDPERIRRIFPSRVSNYAAATALARNPKALANTVYANRMGNGDAASGDGWKYRGRGVIQLTGRNNYSDAAVELGRPYIAQPELVAQPSDACLTAAWFWHCNKLNLLADRQDIRSITKAINGAALVGLADRQKHYHEAVLAFC